MAHCVVYENNTDLKYELKKCKECSCSRCSLNGTPGCYVEIAIKEIDRYEHAMEQVMEQVSHERLETTSLTDINKC